MLHAYVLTANHVHPARDAGQGRGDRRLMQSLGRRYVGHVNRRYGRTGTLWERHFKSTIVDAEGYVMACPVHRSQSPESQDGRLGRGLPLVQPWPQRAGPARSVGQRAQAYASLGDTPEARQGIYREMFAAGLIDELLQVLRDSVQRGWAPRSDRFRRQIEAALGRKVDAPVRGRPRKNAEEMRADPQPLLL